MHDVAHPAIVQQVMYDASGVRLHAGRQASVLNMIITELPPDHPVSDTRPLRDTLGHTPLQVCVACRLHPAMHPAMHC
jgi:acid phosphatase family membrane protein YuiD